MLLLPPWSIFLFAVVISTILTWFVRGWALRSGLSVKPIRDRDIHQKKIPRLGGIAIASTFIILALGIYQIAPWSLTFVTQKAFGIDRNLAGILAGVLLLLIAGAYDDVYDLKPLVKLAIQIVAGILVVTSGIFIWHLTNPLGGTFNLGPTMYVLVVLWVVLIINAVNWLDGLDGLASGVSLIATVTLYLIAIKPSVAQPAMALLGLILAGAITGFLPWNFSPAKIFLGDSGSMVLGFLIAVFAIISGGKVATAFLVLGVPVLDAFWVIVRRILAHQPVYQADRYHLHHRLLRAGLNQRQAVILMYVIAAAFGIVALQTQTYGKMIAGLILIGLMVVGGAAVVIAGLRHEAKTNGK